MATTVLIVEYLVLLRNMGVCWTIKVASSVCNCRFVAVFDLVEGVEGLQINLVRMFIQQQS